jgi:hypothetical protein
MRPLQHAFAAAAVGALLAALSGASFGASQLFKCVEGGRTVYQQQACPVSSQPEPAASSAARLAAKTAVAGSDAASAPARKLRPPSLASSAPATSP